MKMNKNKKITIIVLVVIIYSILLVKFASNPTVLISSKTNDKYLSRFIENYNILKENWYYFQGEKEVLEAATNAMTNSNSDNDHYSQYIESDQSEEYFENMDSAYVGIGIQYFTAGQYPLVTKVYPNSPASKAKIKVGDVIEKIDNKDISKMKSEDIKALVVGQAGTKVEITLKRSNKEIKVSPVRAELDTSVQYSVINKKGYIKIDEFSKTTDVEVKKALDYLKAKNVKTLILDLRNNPGGYLDALERTADLFLKKDQVILKTKDKNNEILEYKTTEKAYYENDKILLLVNNNTASAAEAFTAAMNENLNIPIYGETTFGKGIMQNFFEYSDKAYLKYTSAEWLTPKGNSINKKGIEPTNKVSKGAVFEATNYSYSFEKDLKNDTVNGNLISYQKALKALGYDCKREDGYYSNDTKKAVEKLKNKYNLSKEKDLSIVVQAKIVETIFVEINDIANDKVLQEVIK
ncbi:S41 family peptidase [Mycoplasma sp. P36-A1]|uniref:S41 family peptidase n=1 Tax=Mycoplasma sp. P36-A1 TaxID=3252900 RepID=UPI003C2EE090